MKPASTTSPTSFAFNAVYQFRVERFARLAFRRDAKRVQPALPRARQSRRGLDIADDNSNLGAQLPCRDVCCNGFKVGSPARKKNSDPAIARPDLHAR